MERPLQIEWKSQATRDLRRLAPAARVRVIEKVEQYAANPASLRNQVTRVVGSDYLRLRVGRYRVLFIRGGGVVAIMLILRVRHRREAYG